MRFALCLLVSLILHALVAWRISSFQVSRKIDDSAALERGFVEISISERDVETAPPQVANDAPAMVSAPKPPEVRVLVSEAVHEGFEISYPQVSLPEPAIEPAELPQEAMEAPEQAHIEGEVKINATIRAKYPRRSRERGEEGEVVLEVEVTEAGKADKVRIIHSSGHDLLDKAATEAAKSAIYTPATRDGHPVGGSLTLHIVFRLTM